VHGKLKIRRWDSGERQGTAVEIDAIHIGHDLTRGIASFTRTKRPSAELNQDLLGMDWEDEPGSTAA
jgi:single-strand DNA-binding protein